MVTEKGAAGGHSAFSVDRGENDVVI